MPSQKPLLDASAEFLICLPDSLAKRLAAALVTLTVLLVSAARAEDLACSQLFGPLIS